jgi:hypothetical protein
VIAAAGLGAPGLRISADAQEGEGKPGQTHLPLSCRLIDFKACRSPGCRVIFHPIPAYNP